MNQIMEEVISKGDSTLISYKGNLSAESLDDLFQAIEDKLANSEIEQKKKKKIYYIAVECLQNVYRHAPFRSVNQHEAEFAIVLKSEDCIIATGNYILNSDAGALTSLLDAIINTDDDMQNQYRERLAGSEFSEKGGAGLGLIDIKRKSKSIRYYISPATGELSYFLLVALI